jgi:mannan endo-1,4-beta-mannosidase
MELIVPYGARLTTHSGRPWKGIGCNCYYLAIDNISPAVVDEIVGKAAGIGLNVIRLWAFHEGEGKPTAIQTGPGVFVEERLRFLDLVLDRMSRSGIRAILALTDYWGAYGGMQQWVNWFGGGDKELFYVNFALIDAWKGSLRTLLTRTNTINGRNYAEDPTVLAWQLANEPRCKAGQSILSRWMLETSAFLKHDLGVRQLVTTGMEGFYGEGTQFVEQHALPDIDVAGFHVYPDHWRLSPRQVRRWVHDHLRDANAKLGKPVMLDEFGLMVPPNTMGERNQHFRDVLALCEKGDADVACFWMLYEEGHPNFDRFGVYAPQDAETIAILRGYAEKVRRHNESSLA